MARRLLLAGGLLVVLLVVLLAWPDWLDSDVDPAEPPASPGTLAARHATAPVATDPARAEVGPGQGAVPPALPGTGNVVVTLTWEGEGAPVAGHEVIATSRWQMGQQAPSASARSDAQGRAELALPPGRHIVLALQDLGTAVDVAPGATSDLHLVLPRAGVVLGRVIDERGLPVAGAEVRSLRGDLPGRGGSVLALTDGEGRFRAQLGSRMCFVQARKAGHGASAAAQVYGFPGTQEQLELVLAVATTRLSGRAVDVTGQPVVGARVVLVAPEPPLRGEPYVEPGLRDETRTGADGSFEFVDVPPGVGSVLVVARGFLLGSAPFTAQLGVSADCRVTLKRAARIEGRVVDRHGRPVAGARISASAWHASDGFTAADGTFVRDGQPGRNEVRAFHVDHGAAGVRVELADGEVRTVELSLADEPLLRGRVVDEAGASASGLWVLLMPETPSGESATHATLTDRDGRFEFLACASGPHRLTVRPRRVHAGPPWLTAQVVPGPRDAAPLELSLRAGSRPSAYLALQVTDPADPQRPVQVEIEHLESRYVESPLLTPGKRVGPLVPGTYRIRHHYVHGADPPLLGLELGPIALVAGEERDLGSHVLAPRNGVDLTLRCGDAPPPVRPRLRLQPESGGASLVCGLDDRGTFWPRSLPVGRYHLVVEEGDTHAGASAAIDVSAGRTVSVVVDLAPLQPCEFELAWPSDRPRPHRLAGTVRSGEASRAVSFFHGVARLGLPAGRHRVEVATSDFSGAADLEITRLGEAVVRATVR